MSQLHPIDKPDGGYKNLEIDEFMVFCILDTATTYEQVCKAFNALKSHGLTTRKGLRQVFHEEIDDILTDVGYRWHNQKAKYLKEFANNSIDLTTASREEIVKSIKGVGMKLASMFLRNTRGEQYAVLDVHTLRWLKDKLVSGNGRTMTEKEYNKLPYKMKEHMFRDIAASMGKSVKQLDLEIWEANRVGNRKQ